MELRFVIFLWSAFFSSTLAWDYGENGKDWSKEGMCAGDGQNSVQSPINLPQDATPAKDKKLFLRYPPSMNGISMYNNGNSIALTLPEAYKGGFGFVADESELTSPTGAVYRLWQVSFHSPSEHRLAGVQLPLEMQMVHKRVTGGSELAVVSVFFQESTGASSPLLAALLDGHTLPPNPWDEVEINLAPPLVGTEDPKGFQNALRGSAFYAYMGSLTVPPCETGVKHFVRRDPILATPNQLRPFREALVQLCPPMGNFRELPFFSTASNEVVMVGTYDTFKGITVEADALPSSAAGPGTGVDANAAEAVASRPELQVLDAYDSTAMAAAKSLYGQANMELKAANTAKAHAYRELQQVLESHAKAHSSGINTSALAVQWKEYQARHAVEAAEVRVRYASREAELAAKKVLEIFRLEHAQKHQAAKGIAAVKMTTSPPTERGSDQRIATTMIPYTVGVKSTEGGDNADTAMGFAHASSPIEYPDEIALPSGLAASPFTSDMPHTHASIGHDEWMQKRGVPSSSFRIAPNLRQLDGPPGSVPAPRVRSAAERAAAAGALQPVSLRVRLPIPASAVTNPYTWAEELRSAVAADLGVPEQLINVEKPEAVEYTMQTPVPPFPPPASLLQEAEEDTEKQQRLEVEQTPRLRRTARSGRLAV